MFFISICSKCGATNDGTIIGLNSCHSRNPPENHSFPNVPARGEDLAATVTAQAETIIKKFFLTQVANRAGTEDSVILSPAGYCQRLEEKIHYEKVIQQSVPTGKQIVPTKDLENIQIKAENEKQFVSLITPFLNKVISNISKDLILVNCEDYKWICQHDIPGKTSSDLKPDLFVTRRGIQIAREEPSNQLLNEYRNKNLSKKDYRDLNFGMMPWRGKCYVRVIMEFMDKNLMDRGDFEEKRGKVFQYLSFLIGDDMDTYYTGILCGRDGFTSVTWHGIDRPLFGPITSWNLLGSEEIFRGLIQKDSKNVWLLLLENALQHFKVQLQEHSSFLGAGRFGHVFHVLKGRTKSSHALKIVKYDELEISGATAIQMDMEFRMLKDLQDRDDVVKLAKDSALYVIYEGTEKIGYAYLMATVGTPILPHTLTEPLIKEIFASLLVFHQAGYYHGDCRLQNLLLKDKKVVFCDFRHSMHSESDDREQFGRDFRTLIKSILRHDRIYGKLSHLLAAYVKEPSLDEQNDIIKSLGDETCLVWKKYDVIELRPSVKITTTDIHKVIDQTLFLREWHRVTGEGEGSQNKRKTAGGYDMLEIYNATGGLLPVERGGQGDCFFPALAAQLNLPESPFRDQGWDAVRLREAADDALDKFYLKYLTTDEQTFLEAQAYLSKPNRKGWWADNFLIVPLVTSLQINLRIWYSTTLTSHDFGIGGPFTANLWYDPDIHYRSLEPGNKPVLEAERESSKKATGDEDSKSTQVKKKSKK